MDLSLNELKEIWARTDEYFQFRYEEYSTFGARLKKWRELNDISQMEMAEAIYNYRKYLGLENDDVSDEILKKEYEGDEKYKPIDYEVDTKREQKKERRIMSLMRTYHKWESKETDAVFADILQLAGAQALHGAVLRDEDQIAVVWEAVAVEHGADPLPGLRGQNVDDIGALGGAARLGDQIALLAVDLA